MRLCEFTGEKGIDIAAEALPLIMRMKFNPKTVEWLKAYREKARAEKNENSDTADKNIDVSPYVYYGTMIKNDKEAAVELFALLNEKDPEEYKRTTNAGVMLNDMYNAFVADDELMMLFGLRLPGTNKSSGEPTENTEENGK